MSELENRIRRAHAAGALDVLSVFGPRPGSNHPNTCQGNFRTAGAKGWRCTRQADPVDALVDALSDFADDTNDNGDPFA